MTFNDYIQNPMGVKNAVISNREMYRTMYTKKWDAIKLRENGIINYTTYISKTDFYVYIKIPSEVIPDFYYDVIVQFTPPKNHKGADFEQNLANYDVKFFSNDPSFVFTFAHAFKKNDMFIDDLSARMSKIALKKVASERNPGDQVGYVKSIYFAYLEISKRMLLKKLTYSGSQKWDKERILSMIMPADEKIDRRKAEEEKLKAKKKRTHRDEKKPNTKEKNDISTIPISPIKAIASKSKISRRSAISGKSKISAKRKSSK